METTIGIRGWWRGHHDYTVLNTDCLSSRLHGSGQNFFLKYNQRGIEAAFQHAQPSSKTMGLPLPFLASFCLDTIVTCFQTERIPCPTRFISQNHAISTTQLNPTQEKPPPVMFCLESNNFWAAVTTFLASFCAKSACNSQSDEGKSPWIVSWCSGRVLCGRALCGALYLWGTFSRIFMGHDFRWGSIFASWMSQLDPGDLDGFSCKPFRSPHWNEKKLCLGNVPNKTPEQSHGVSFIDRNGSDIIWHIPGVRIGIQRFSKSQRTVAHFLLLDEKSRCRPATPFCISACMFVEIEGIFFPIPHSNYQLW